MKQKKETEGEGVERGEEGRSEERRGSASRHHRAFPKSNMLPVETLPSLSVDYLPKLFWRD